MQYNKIQKAVFVSRPNRFIANVLIDGKPCTVHVKNTGRCKEILISDATVYLEDFGENPSKRKTRYSLVAVEKKVVFENNQAGHVLINMDSQAPNKAVKEALLSGKIILNGIKNPLKLVQGEKTFGSSRFDFYVEGESDGVCKERKENEVRKAFIEVKGVTLENSGFAKFPDAPTERGVKHIKGLIQAHKEGFDTYILFLIQMSGMKSFSPNDETHPEFGRALREAYEEGVNILVYECNVTSGSLDVTKQIEFQL